MPTLPKLFVGLLLCSLAASLARAVDTKKKPPQKPEKTAQADSNKADADNIDKAQLEREAAFEKLLSGATLVGHFTVTGEKAIGEPKEEKYTITKVSKVQGDIWLFQVRIQYGDHDVTLPLPLPVKWVGDTPMIYLDNMPVPGLGTFNSRVIFSEGKYAGTWSGKDHGGHLYGRIVPPAMEEKEAAPAEEKKE